MTSLSTADQPLQVDTIIHARWVIPMSENGLVLEHHSLVIKEGEITAIVPSNEVKTAFYAETEYDLSSHALIPGLINSHGHSPMTLFRGFADDMPLRPWLEEKIWPAEGKWVSEEFVRDGARHAIAEMLRSGTTCFSDMYFFPDQIAKVALEAKIRVQLAAPVLDFPTIWAQNADEYIHKATQLHDQYRNSDLVHTAFGPHAPYTVSDEPLTKLAMLADELDIPVHIHLHENTQEISDSISSTGFRPLNRLKQLGILSPRLQCVHMTQLLDEEITLLNDFGVNVVHCPASNMKLANGFCPTHDLMNAGINISLGTDGCASNNDLDMFNEMRLAAFTGKAYAQDASALSAWQVLAMATINGAKAMGLEQKSGSLEPGKWADITAINLDFLNTQPVYDPVSTLVYSAQSQQVSHVWVGGNLNLEEGKLLSVNADSIKDKARQWADKIKQD